ncbi:MAG: DUF4115 domain-containing protein [Alphaproteobacteria bacterium]|jgi:cytoskeletal protein RodZ|nr:DUF4115 domain-containing protein [Alphaproteobacteria bacterium]
MTDNHERQITETLELGLTVGCVIQDARKRQKIKLKTISEDLKISVKYLEGIEHDDYSKFPGDAYMTGFVKNYANYLGLDGDDVVKQLIKEQFSNKKAHVFNRMGQEIEPIKKKKPVYEKLIHQENGDFSNLGLIVLAVIITLIVILFSVFNKTADVVEYNTSSIVSEEEVIESNDMPVVIDNKVDFIEEDSLEVEKMPEEVEEVVEVEKTMLNPHQISIEEIVMQEPSVYGQRFIKDSLLTISLDDTSWIDVYDNDERKSLFVGTFYKNDKIIVPNKSDLILNAGNAGGVSLIYKGKQLKSLGENGEATGYISLSNRNLRKERYRKVNKED